MLKLLALFGLTVVIFFLQIYSQGSQSKNEATVLLEILKKVVDESIADAKLIVDATAAKVEATGGFVEISAEDAINVVESGFKDQLDTFKEMAMWAKVSIRECLAEDEERVMSMPHQFSIYLLHNVSYKVMEGVSCVIDAMDNAKDVNNDIPAFEQQISDCKDDVSSTNCLDKLTEKIEKAIVSFPNKIRNFVKIGKALAEDTCRGIEDYASRMINDLENEGGAVLATIFDCVERIGL